MKLTNILSAFVLFAVTLVSCSGTPTKPETKEQIITANPGKSIIVDVRTVEEWNNDGHANCTVNYPLDVLSTKIDTLKTFDNIILVCRSGNRAGIAKDILEQKGIRNIKNMGAWQNIVCK